MFFQRYGSLSAGQTILAALLFVSGPAVLHAQPIRSEFEAVDRIVAIGDVHGAFGTFVANLKATGLVDDGLDWIGAETHPVQTGDVPDRGPDSRKVLDLLMKLEPQAEAAGGKVHALIGNHEFYNVVGALGYVSEAEVKAFDDNRDHALRRFRDVKNVPRGLLAHREAYSAEGKYGQWLRKTQRCRPDWGSPFRPRRYYSRDRGTRDRGDQSPRARRFGQRGLARKLLSERRRAADDTALFRHQIPDAWVEGVRDELSTVLAALAVRTMVMAHTVTFGLIEPRFDGAAILIDTGMFEDYVGGHQAALVIEKWGEKERFYAVYERGKVELPMSSRDADLDRYIEAAAEVSPNGDGLKRHLADVRKRQKRYEEAAELYEKIGVSDSKRELPLRWRREAGECYEALGDKNKARKLFTLYVEELERFAESMAPSRLQLLNQYAWECLRLGLETEKDLEVAREVSAAYPDNPSYRVTLAWAHLDNGDAREARQILIALPEESRDRFYVQLDY